jgi:hypothetical protein
VNNPTLTEFCFGMIGRADIDLCTGIHSHLQLLLFPLLSVADTVAGGSRLYLKP